ncbi:Polyhomeotic-like protein 3 [Triplophysa tibetana]|uniref:Polyhomeotic-like protein 3 n=1 Tax=Triplophysa tibetana TaxID=1572043 RepID=A0A5A9PAF4_9TELE|nr:Polyhomeotic-like protein 3 [Triplophysa tibetana]
MVVDFVFCNFSADKQTTLMGDAEKQGIEEMEVQSCVPAASSTTAPTNNTAVSSTPRPNTPIGTQAISTTIGNVSSDRQAVQVIQQTLHRPQSMTAQYLQQMYAAQQQHILLQTAAFQQQHQQNLTAAQILSTTQQASQTNGRQPTSCTAATNGNVTLASVTQTTITMPTSPVTQPIGRIQASSSNSTGGAISQQTMLLGNSSPTGSQAQMYLRTQMLILTPAATVATVQPDLTVASSQSASSQSTQIPQNLVESSRSESFLADVTQPPSTHPLIAPSTFSPVQTHTLVRHHLHCPPSQRVAPHHLFIQQSTSDQRQLQPIALRVTSRAGSPPPLALQTRSTPTTATVQSQHTDLFSAPSSTNHPANPSSVVSTSTLTPATLPNPPPLHLGAALEPVSQYSPLACPPPLTMALPRLMQPPRLSLRSVQTVAVQSDHVLVSEEELPVAEALVQLPFQTLPPPQTVAVDLKVQPSAQTKAPAVTQLFKETGCMNLMKNGLRNKTPTPPPASPPAEPQTTFDDVTPDPENCTADQDQPCVLPAIDTPEDPTYAKGSPPPLLSSAVRSSSRLPPASLPGNPEGQPSQAIVRPHILTHLIEGFVIREGLEPFPVCPLVDNVAIHSRHEALIAPMVNASLTKPSSSKISPSLRAQSETVRQVVGSREMNVRATLTVDGEKDAHGGSALMDDDHPDNSSDSDMDDLPAEDEQTVENMSDVLECEFCGKRGFAHTFLRSKRFCSMTCVRRFNVSCKKRLNLLRAEKISRWPHRPMGRRGRPPSRVKSVSREHYFRKLQEPHPTDDGQRVSNSSMWIEREEEDPPGPMTTRLRLQVEREKEQDREREQSRVESCSSSVCFLDSRPSQWSVENACSFIASLPGCQELAAEFRSQEIDGQALLLLTEDHLMSAMNIKLGPALKICARINSLKEP